MGPHIGTIFFTIYHISKIMYSSINKGGISIVNKTIVIFFHLICCKVSPMLVVKKKGIFLIFDISFFIIGQRYSSTGTSAIRKKNKEQNFTQLWSWDCLTMFTFLYFVLLYSDSCERAKGINSTVQEHTDRDDRWKLNTLKSFFFFFLNEFSNV